jgi:hypothetical protein
VGGPPTRPLPRRGQLPPPAPAVSQVPLPIGLTGFVMLVEELRSILMHLGSVVMNGRRMLMCPNMPALMLLVQALPVGFAHNPSVSRKAS